MNDITFRPGYYEWLICFNDRVVCALDIDVAELLPESASREDIEIVVDSIIETLMCNLNGDESEVKPEDQEIISCNEDNIRQQMIDVFSGIYL